MSNIVIIGAGIGGLASANVLARAGHTVSVYEASAHPGGRAGQLKADGFTFDTGPSWYLMPEVFERYYQSLGVSVHDYLDIIRLSPAYKVFFESGEPVVISGDYRTDRATFERLEPGSGARLDGYVSRAKKLYALALRYFLYTDFSRLRDMLKPGIIFRTPWLLAVLLRPIHGYVARFVTNQRLQQILEYPMVFLGTSPYEAPALYSLMGALDFDSGVYYPRGGMYTIIESLVAIGTGAGVTYHYDSPVAAITTDDKNVRGVTLENGTEVAADIVISNADIHHTETVLLQPTDQSFPETYWAGKKVSCSALLIYLGITGTADELEHHNLLFVDDWRGNFDALYHDGAVPDRVSLYLSRTSKTDPDVAPNGCETLFILVPLPVGSDLGGEEAEAMAAHFIAQIEQQTHVTLHDRIVYQSIRTPQDFGNDFHAWQNAMLGPSHVLTQSAFWRTPNKSKKLANLYYVGAGTTPGVGLPMCLISAQNVADRIAREHAS